LWSVELTYLSVELFQVALSFSVPPCTMVEIMFRLEKEIDTFSNPYSLIQVGFSELKTYLE